MPPADPPPVGTPAAPGPLQAWLHTLPPDVRAAREADLERLARALAHLIASAYQQKVVQARPEEAADVS